MVEKRLADICHLQGDDKRSEKYLHFATHADPESASVHKAYENIVQDRENNEKTKEQKIFLSACYIVRNESDNLRRSLESIAGEADEVVVVDTGSVDDTMRVAEAYGAICSYFPWKDDFSAARNFALEQVKGEWVLFLDADEYFNKKTEGRIKKFLKECTGENLLAFFWRNIDAESGEILLDSYAPRLFRNRKDFRYEGRIHEQLLDHGKAISHIAQFPKDSLILMHTGYSKSVNREKAERNLKLLLQELQTAKYPELLYMYLAEAYEGIEDEESAIFYAEKDITSGRKPVAFASRSYRVLLRLLAKRQGGKERRLKIAEAAVRDFPEVPEFHAEYGECLAARGDYGAAVAELEQAEDRLDKPSGWEPSMFSAEMCNLLVERKKQWKAMAEKKRTKMPDEQEVFRLLLEEMKRLPPLLFLLERKKDIDNQSLYSSCRELLPPKMDRIWRAYEQGTDDALSEEGYEMILEAAIRYGTEEQLLKWVDAARSFSPENLVRIGNRLAEDEHWQAALNAYSMVSVNADCVDSDFWFHVGCCLYHLDEKDGAAESMEKALDLNPECKRALSWLKWLREEGEKC